MFSARCSTSDLEYASETLLETEIVSHVRPKALFRALRQVGCLGSRYSQEVLKLLDGVAQLQD